MRFNIILFFLIIPTILFSKNVINSGHQTPVKFIEYLDSEDLFFTLSEDGTLVIKKNNNEKIHKRFFISNNNINKIVLSNTSSKFLIVEADNASQFVLSVWDWKLERKLYSINLTDYPIYVGFSGAGNYFYVTSVSSNPIKVFNSKTGAITSFLNNNKNFIDYVYIGSSEQVAYLYSSSGQLDIMQLSGSKLLKSIKTEKNLTNMTISSDKRFLIGRKNDLIYSIGRNDGIIYDKIEIPNLSLIKMNSNTGELITYTDSSFKKALRNIQIVNGNFFESSVQDILIKSSIVAFDSSYNQIIYADNKGLVYNYDNWLKENSIFLKNDILNIDSISIIDDIATLLTYDSIYLFKSPFFSDRLKNSRRLTDFTIEKINTPLINPTGSMNLNGNLLLWNSKLLLYNFKEKKVIFSYEFSSEIIDIKLYNNTIIVLDKNGELKIIDLENNSIVFSFKSPGFTSTSFYSDNEIIGGVDKSLGGSLMRVDLTTKETLPLQTTLDVVFNILQSKNKNIIYLVGLKKINNLNQTYIVEYNLLTKNEKVLLNNNNEELHSFFDLDDNNSIYTNLGTKSLLKIETNSNRKKPFQLTTNQTKNILYDNGAIYTVNENKSLSIWNPSTGKKIIDFYLFKDNEWIAITPDSVTAFGSPNSDKYLSIN